MCLAFNPFVMDYFVAARGYGLALGFLTSEIFFLNLARDIPYHRLRAVLAASISAGLSISSNFSFGVAAVIALLVFGSIFLLDKNEKERVKVGLALIVPAPFLALCICGPALTTFDSKRELVYGASSIGQMLGSVLSNSFDGPSLYLVNPNILPLVIALRNAEPFLIAAVFAVSIVLLVRDNVLARNAATPILIILIATIVLETVLAIHSHTLLPLNRTILFAAPLATFIVCFAASTVRPRFVAKIGAIVMAGAALFFVLSIRTYFREWAFDSNVAQVYEALRDVEQSDPGLTVVTDDKYLFGLNFYQAIDAHPNLPPIVYQLPAVDIPDSRAVYVLSEGDDDAFVKLHGLKIIYSYPGVDSPDTQIAVKSAIAQPILPRPPVDHPGAS